MNVILFPDSTPTTSSTDDYFDGEFAINSTTQWDLLSNETNVVEFPLTRRERGFICWLICTQLPDPALQDLKNNILESIDFYIKRDEFRQRHKPKLSPPSVTVEIGKAKTRPPFFLPYDDD